MDSAVIAALITTPTAVLAAGAAYAAGRAQGRSTVDAVRRQHQREAYAHLRTTARTFTKAVENVIFSDAFPPDLAHTFPLDERLRAADHTPVEEAASAVILEGPPPVAELAQKISDTAEALPIALHAGYREDLRPADSEDVQPETFRNASHAMHEDLRATIAEFTKAASTYLNTGKIPRRRSRRLVQLGRIAASRARRPR